MKINREKPTTFRPTKKLLEMLDKEIAKPSNPRNRSEEIIYRLEQTFQKELRKC